MDKELVRLHERLTVLCCAIANQTCGLIALTPPCDMAQWEQVNLSAHRIIIYTVAKSLSTKSTTLLRIFFPSNRNSSNSYEEIKLDSNLRFPRSILSPWRAKFFSRSLTYAWRKRGGADSKSFPFCPRIKVPPSLSFFRKTLERLGESACHQ